MLNGSMRAQGPGPVGRGSGQRGRCNGGGAEDLPRRACAEGGHQGCAGPWSGHVAPGALVRRPVPGEGLLPFSYILPQPQQIC